MFARKNMSNVILGVNIGQRTISACVLVGNDFKIITDVENTLSSTILFNEEILYGRKADSNNNGQSLSVKAIKEVIGLNNMPEYLSQVDKGYEFVSDANGKPMIHFNNHATKFQGKRAVIYQEFVYALLLQNIVRKAIFMVNSKVDKVVISVPASYTLNQIQAVRKAAKLIRLRILAIVTEDQAMCVHYNSTREYTSQSTILLDLGGGFFHVSCLRTQNGIVSVVDSLKSDRLSGSRIDSSLRDYLFSTIRSKPIDIDIEKLKIDLSRKRDVTILLDDFLTFTQDMVKEGCSQIYREIVSFVSNFMQKNSAVITKDTPIIVVGGNSQIPSLKESLQNELMNVNFLNIQDHAVACGCVLLGRSILENESKVCNVLPHTLYYSIDQQNSFLLFDQYTPLSQCNKVVDGISQYLSKRFNKLYLFDSKDSYIGYFELPVNHWPAHCTCWFKVNEQFEVQLTLVNSKGECVQECPFHSYNDIPAESEEMFVMTNDVFLLLKRILCELSKDKYINAPGICDILSHFHNDIRMESELYLCPSNEMIAQLKQMHNEYPTRYEKFYKNVL